MDFYTSITEYYDHIFPLNIVQVDFVRGAVKNSQASSLLDIGCGTGNLALELSKYFKEIFGIDFNKTMLRKANENISNSTNNTRFVNLDMMKVDKVFCSNRFDVIVCFGNTLVHLDSEEKILDFFIKSRKILKSGGKLLFQIINYDRIIGNGVNGLPVIENDVIKFERNYKYHNENNVIDFETILTVKDENRQIKNLIPLNPLRKSQVEELLSKAGFGKVNYYGNFKKEKLLHDSVPLVVEVIK